MTPWVNDPERVTFMAATHTRGKNTAFGIRAKDRDKHIYMIGKSGMGKSTLLENMAIQDIQNGEGMIFIDPHGSTAEKILDFIPESRIQDTMYFAPFDVENPIGFNILEDVGYDNRHKVVAGLMGVFERIWADAWSARMQYILQNTLFALLEYPGATIIDVNRMLVNKAFREDVIQHITDPIVGMFWKEEFAGYSDKYTQDATPAIQNKIGQFVSNPLIRNILGQSKSTFDFRKMMDERKIVIVNLSKGRMGEANASLLGSMLVIKVYLSALSRAEESAQSMRNIPNCYFYVDEFQNVTNRAFENILSEARKYKLCLTIANQYIEQMEEEVRNAVFGNVGTTVIFRVGPMDAQFLEPVFGPTFLPEDMVGLGRGDIYLNLMIDGVGSAPFSAHTLPPVDEPSISFKDDVIEWTKLHYGRPRVEVEKEVNEAGEKWQSAAKEKHKTDSAKGQSKGPAKPPGTAYGSRPRPEPVAAVLAPVSVPASASFQPAPDMEARTVSEPREEPTPAPMAVRHTQPSPPEPPKETRSPADVLRSMREKKDQFTQTMPKAQNEPKPDVRDALKAAIASARISTPQGSSAPVGRPAPRPQIQQQRPQFQQPKPYQSRPAPPLQQQPRAAPMQQPQPSRPTPPPPTPAQPREQQSAPPPPRPASQPQRDTPPPQAAQTKNPGPSTQGGVDPTELRRVLYGDDNQTLD